MYNKLSAAVSRNIKADSIKEQDEDEVEEEINLETYSVLWCDENVNKTDENREIQTELRRAINYLKTFDSTGLCRHYIQRKSNEEIVLIVSGRIGSQLVPEIYDLLLLVAIYVYCFDKDEYLLW
ncbi:unnamed protein product [Didymodactylos carnosus]|uniref:Uncharacterized protein n=1 Tax=Didymodactylos carnosus TaxID=1234261 RepID=A0A815YL87_9BILA|nr:unnamed protein product [Didymodactylos carnosus]CAF4435031.1 unnamed protein product [Didymodactylos carnosus]